MPLSASDVPDQTPRRRLVGLLALGGIGAQGFLIVLGVLQRDVLQGVMGAAVLAALLWTWSAHHRQRLETGRVTQVVAALILLRSVVDLFQDLALGITPGLLFFLEFQMLALLLFSSLSVVWTLPVLGTLYVLLVAVSYAGGTPEPNPAALLLLPIVLGVTAFTALYGLHMTEERLRSAYLRGQLARDALTGTLSRREMQGRLDALAQEPGRPRHLLLLLDVDHFKAVNDVHGHHIGDQALQLIGATLHANVRAGDLVSRWGGEEFVVLLRGVEAPTATRLTTRLLGSVRALSVPGVPPLTLSAGGAWLNEAPTLTGALQLADRRMYAAKAAGRDRFCLSDPADADTPGAPASALEAAGS